MSVASDTDRKETESQLALASKQELVTFLLTEFSRSMGYKLLSTTATIQMWLWYIACVCVADHGLLEVQ